MLMSLMLMNRNTDDSAMPTIIVHIHYCTQFSPPGCEHADVLVVVIWTQSILGDLVAAWKGLLRPSFICER